ncbi:MAG: YdcF family protein [Flavobacteriales bacterium]|nr:YdcF family protein [Flavobacteriales bacterium]MCB9198409.1 YdcF family protein [Flavobacteriales bacterium]
MRGVGYYLMAETQLEKADAIFVLGGNINDRPVLAAKLYEEGWSEKIIPLGANFDFAQEVLLGCNPDCMSDDCNPCKPDALLMQEVLEEKLNIPFEAIVPLPEGTSTKEESDAILKFCKENGYQTIIIVSDLFHLKRISYVFIEKFEKEGIKVILRGAKNSQYNEEFWWQYEAGLIMVNNEYIKLMYYWLKGY